MSQTHKVFIPIKMGSKQLKIKYEYTLNDFSLFASQLIEMVLKKLYPRTKKYDQLKKTYSLFENVYGVERLVGNRENVLNIVSNHLSLNTNICFVIRKYCARNVPQKLDSRKCFEKLKKIKKETFTIQNQIKDNFLQQIIHNEIILEEQILKLEAFDSVLQRENGKSTKKNIFQSFYTKMKISHKKYLIKNKDLNKSKALLLDSTGECSSFSSSSNSSFSKLNTLF